jgi:hypothetical protein
MVAAAATPRGAWARAAALGEVLEAARAARQAGRGAVVVMDLDETVVDSTPRRWAASRDVAQVLCGTGALSAPACETALSLNLSEIYRLANSYDSAALARRLGFDPRAREWDLIASEMLKAYLSGRYEQWDQPVPGSNAYVHELRQAGARVYFVSSRFDDVQRASTLASLRALGFVGEGPAQADERDVVLRPRAMSSIEFKRWAFGRIKVESAGARVVGAFENEPENIQAMKAAFPGARLVFVEGAWIKDGVVPFEAARVADYRELKHVGGREDDGRNVVAPLAVLA